MEKDLTSEFKKASKCATKKDIRPHQRSIAAILDDYQKLRPAFEITAGGKYDENNDINFTSREIKDGKLIYTRAEERAQQLEEHYKSIPEQPALYVQPLKS